VAKYELEVLTVGPLEVNCYLLACAETRAAAIIDPGTNGEEIVFHLRELGWNPAMVVNTHGHLDHWSANADVAEAFGIPVYFPKDDLGLLQAEDIFGLAVILGTRPCPPPAGLLEEGSRLELGRLVLAVRHTPGHTPGGCCLLVEDLCFTGDTLFAGGVGRTDLPGGDFEQLLHSIRAKILSLPDGVRVLPGHGPASTVGEERRHNPYLQLGL
jgi:hydroxyacylglutathione hydrolase